MASEPVARIAIDPETIGHLLKDCRLKVPIHQRSYAWEDEHVTDLFQDLTKALKDGEPEYFLGSIVLIKAEDASLEVNDGQQRLATSVILLAAIRDYFHNLGDKTTSDLVERELLVSIDRKSHELIPKLQLNVDDNEFFVKRILRLPNDKERESAQPSKESHKKIEMAARLAAKHIRNLVAPLREEDRPDQLHR